jgi:hypothetical protein
MTPDDLIKIIKEYRASKKDYGSLDSVLYNGGVVFTLLCTGAATILGAKGVDPTLAWLPPLLTGLATIWVGIDRALQFGPRWTHHRTVNASFDTLNLRLQTLSALPEEARAAELAAIRNSLVELPGMQKVLPGIGGTTTKG